MLAKSSSIVIFCQILNLFISYASLPALIGGLGSSLFGQLVVIIAIGECVQLLDFGLLNSTRNNIGILEQKARNTIISEVFVILTMISTLLLFLLLFSFFCFNYFYSNENKFHFREKELAGVIIFFIVTCARLPLSILNTYFLAINRSVVPSALMVLSNVISLASIFLVYYLGSINLVNAVLIYSIPQLFVLISSLIFFQKRLVFNINFDLSTISCENLRKYLMQGKKFFLIQLSSIVNFYSPTFVLLLVINSAAVGQYNISYRYINMLSVMYLASLTPLWSWITTTYLQRKFKLINENIKKYQKFLIVLIFLGMTMIILSENAFFYLTNGKIVPDIWLLSIFLVNVFFYCQSTLFRNLMNATGKIRAQSIFVIIQSFFSIPTCIFLGIFYGIYGVASALLFWNVLACILDFCQYKKILLGKDHGIWGV